MSLFSRNARGARACAVWAVPALLVAMAVGCGSNYRPVVTPINPSGPAPQPRSYAIAVSSPSSDTPGIASVIDYSGDTLLVQAPIGPGPLAFTVDETGSNGYTINSDGSLTIFPISVTDPQEKDIKSSTLPPHSQSIGLFTPSSGVWVTDLNGNVVDVLTGSPATFQRSIPLAATPVMISGPGTLAQYNFAISLNNVNTPAGSAIGYDDMTCNTAPYAATQTGEADSIQVTTDTISGRIPLGLCPAFGIQSADGKRFFVLNRGSDTITVINSQNDTLDQCTPFVNQNGQPVSCHPCLPLTTAAVAPGDGSTPGSCAVTAGSALGTAPHAGPVYAEYNSATNQLVVADYDAGTISVIDVSLDVYGNDSSTFGTTFTIKVGNTATPYPASVTVLNDGSRAYTANQGDDDGTGNGTVTVVNLSSHTVEKTLAVVGHPRTVVSTQNSLYGKVYVASPDSNYLTILRTDQDIVDTTVLLQGDVIDVRTSTQNANSGNAITSSRRPGAGQPCYLPPALDVARYGAGYTTADCQTLP